MTPERYKRIGELFDEALELAPAERALFLQQACGEDAGVSAEVEKLLRGTNISLSSASTRSG